MYTLVVEPLVGKYEYTAKPKGSFWCHDLDTKGVVLLLTIDIHK